MNGYKPLALAALALALCAASQAAPVASGFNSASQLDLDGNFVYALTMNTRAAGVTIRDASFTSAFSTAGASLSYTTYEAVWHPNNYVGPDANKLGNVMTSIIWSDVMAGRADKLELTLNNLQVGQTYKAQLMFGEACCTRGYDIYQDGQLLFDNFSAYQLSGNSLTGSAFFANTFVATASSVTFTLKGDGGLSDRNPILNAATLERVSAIPEPATTALLGVSALAALAAGRRRRTTGQ